MSGGNLTKRTWSRKKSQHSAIRQTQMTQSKLREVIVKPRKLIGLHFHTSISLSRLARYSGIGGPRFTSEERSFSMSLLGYFLVSPFTRSTTQLKDCRTRCLRPSPRSYCLHVSDTSPIHTFRNKYNDLFKKYSFDDRHSASLP
jgi:hypothetical protein